MLRKVGICAASLVLVTVGLSAHAQGRSGGAGNPGPTRGPVFQSAGSAGSLTVSTHRSETETLKAEAEARRLAAQHRREQAAENNKSDEARSDHPPSEHAADEAVAAEENAQNSELREERKDLKKDNRGDHGSEQPQS